MNILLVEDDRDTAEMLSMILEREFHANLVWEERGDRAMRAHLYIDAVLDLVVLDGHLPGQSGPEVARFIRRLSPDVPILAYSCDPTMRERFATVEGCRFLKKPFRISELIHAIKRAISSPLRRPKYLFTVA